MHPQLQQIDDQLREASARLRRLQEAVPLERWRRRPGPDRWSIAECVAHLNLTSQAFIPLLERGIETARSLGRAAPARYRWGVVGWLLRRAVAPPVRLRAKTGAAFVPGSDSTPAEVLREFDQLQARILGFVAVSDGLAVDRVTIVSPFHARVRYNVFSSLGIIAVHQHRHLWQAEQATRIDADQAGRG